VIDKDSIKVFKFDNLYAEVNDNNFGRHFKENFDKALFLVD
jgi:hypothetical protein